MKQSVSGGGEGPSSRCGHRDFSLLGAFVRIDLHGPNVGDLPDSYRTPKQPHGVFTMISTGITLCFTLAIVRRRTDVPPASSRVPVKNRSPGPGLEATYVDRNREPTV